MDLTDKMEELLLRPYWIIDLLPMQVPAERAEQYCAAEKFFLQSPSFKPRRANLLVKLNCYYDMTVVRHFAAEDRILDPLVNPDPSELARMAVEENISVLIGETLITSDPYDTYLTLYNENDRLLELVRTIASSEGLFVWQPEKRND